MGTDSFAETIARDNVKHGRDSTPVIVRELLNTIDTLNRAVELAAELAEEKEYNAHS